MDEFDDLPALESDVQELDEKAVAAEEAVRDTRETPPRQTPIIQGIHCGCYLGRMLDMKVIARKLWNAIFDPKRSQNGVLVALRHPRVSVIVFPSGKVISMGAKSEASAILACRKVARCIQRIPGYEAVRMTDFRIHNVTASGCLGYRVDLRALSQHPLHEDAIEYNPDQFPGLHYKLTDDTMGAPVKPEVKPEVRDVKPDLSSPFPWLTPTAVVQMPQSSLTLTVYFSGRYTLVGARHEVEVYRVCARVSRMLWGFRQRERDGGGVEVAYDEWLERVEEEERRRGKLGWEEEAERVRQEMAKREKRAEKAQEEKQPEQKETEVRVKPEPGTVEQPPPPLPLPTREEKEDRREEKEEADKSTDRREEEAKSVQMEEGENGVVVVMDTQQPAGDEIGEAEAVEWE